MHKQSGGTVGSRNGQVAQSLRPARGPGGLIQESANLPCRFISLSLRHSGPDRLPDHAPTGDIQAAAQVPMKVRLGQRADPIPPPMIDPGLTQRVDHARRQTVQTAPILVMLEISQSQDVVAQQLASRRLSGEDLGGETGSGSS